MWFIARGNQRVGTLSYEQLQSLRTRGELTPQDMLLRQGECRWQQASSVQGLFGPAVPLAVPAKAPPRLPSQPSSTGVGSIVLTVLLFPVRAIAYLLAMWRRRSVRTESKNAVLAFGQSLYLEGRGDSYLRSEIAENEAEILNSGSNTRATGRCQARRQRLLLKLGEEHSNQPASSPSIEAQRQRALYGRNQLEQAEEAVRSARAKAWPANAAGKVAVLASAALMLITAGVAVALMFPSPPSEPPAPGEDEPKGRRITNLDVISSSKDENEIAGAVGFVVCGGTFRHKEQRTDRPFSSGTCFCISETGHLVTNEHVIRFVQEMTTDPGAQEAIAELERNKGIIVTPHIWVFFRSKMYPAKIEHVSKNFDLAILKIDRRHRPYFAMSDSDKFPRGESVAACGFPGAARIALSEEDLAQRIGTLENSLPEIRDFFLARDFDYGLTTGTISRTVTEEKERRWIQHNADVSKGNSGGPLLTDDGTAIGINTLIASPDKGQGIFYSVVLSQMKAEIRKIVPNSVWR